MAHCHKLQKLSPHYIMIESTLPFDDVGVVLSLLPLPLAVQRSRMQLRKWSGRWPGNEASKRYIDPCVIMKISAYHMFRLDNCWCVMDYCDWKITFPLVYLHHYQCKQTWPLSAQLSMTRVVTM